MAAGRMFNATAASRRRPIRRRRATGFKKSVAKIAKSVVMRQAETKTGSYNWTTSFGSNGLLQTVWKGVTKGDDQQSREGDRIKGLGFKLRGYVTIDDTILTAKQDTVGYRMIVFKGKRPISTLTDASLSWNSSVDPETVTILYDRYFRFNVDGRTTWINKYFKTSSTVMYELNNVNKGEVYVAFIPYAALGGTGLTATGGLYINMTAQFYMKDL